MKLSEAISAFLETKEAENFSPHTINLYKTQYKMLVKDIGDSDIGDLEVQMLRNHIRKEAEHLKPSSVASKTRSIKSLLSWLYEEEYIDRNIGKRLKEPKEGERVPKALTVEEVELLRDSCKTTFEHALVEFFFATGCRIGEVHRLNKDDINFENHSALVMGKGNKQREVYFGARASIWLKRYIDERNDNDPALFVTRNKPHRMPIHRIWDYFKQVSERCGLKDKVSPHKMRHTFATTMLDNGIPLHMAQSLLGHDKPSTTLLYTKLSGNARKQAYDRYFMQ